MGGGHRPRHALLVVAHAVSSCGLLTAASLSVEALGRVVPGLDPRIDIGHAVTDLGVSGRGLFTATASAVSVRVPMPVGGVRRGRSRSHALPNRSRDRSRSRVRLPASPARLRAVEAGRLARRGPQEGVEAFVSQPPVAWSSGGRPSCSGGASIAALPSVFAGACQVLLELVWLLFPGSTWSLGGCDRFCSSVGGYRVSRFVCCWGGHFLCCDCDACWGWRFCLLLPLLVLAFLVTSSVRGFPALAGVTVGRLVLGPTDVLLSAPEEGLLLLTALRVVVGGAVALPQIRLRMAELTLLLPVPGMRLKVRILVALPGILTARLVLGRRGLLQGLSLASLERVVVRLDLRVWRMLTAPLPSRGFAWREVAWAAFQSPMASSRRSGSSPVLLVSGFWSGFSHPLLGAPLLGRLSVVPAAGLTAVSLAHGLAFGGLPCGGGLPRGY